MSSPSLAMTGMSALRAVAVLDRGHAGAAVQMARQSDPARTDRAPNRD